MSSGHRHHDHPAVSSATMERIGKNPDFIEHLYKQREENNDYDIPFIAGYSKDGGTIYYDRHLPEELELHLDGHKKVIQPREFIKCHEEVEKAVIDSMGWGYYPSHAVATAFEKRKVLERCGPQWWTPYQHVMDGYAKVDEHEKVTRVPGDLDMTPYHAAPVNKPLLRVMQGAMGRNNGRLNKAEVDYSPGHPGSHCGPVPEWPKGACSHWVEPNYCECVRGYISRKYWCNLWAKE